MPVEGLRSGDTPRASTRNALAQRDFALLWSGQALSNIGDQMLPVALALLVLARGQGVKALGIVLAAQAVALGLGAVTAAAVGDRWRRTRTMAIADTIRVLAVAGIAASPHDAPLSAVVLLVVILGVGEGLFQPAYQAVVPRLVPPEAIRSANGLTAFSVHAATIAGPALAGLCSAALGPRAALFADAGTFAVSLGTLVFIRESASACHDAPQPRGAMRGMMLDLREGASAVIARRWVAATIGCVTVVATLAAAPALVLLPVIARERLGGDGGYGAVLSAAGVGALVGSVLVTRIRTSRPGLVAISFSMLNAAAMAGLALLPLPGVIATWALAGLGVTVFNVLWITALQRDVPDRLLGRVMALDWLGSTCFMPLGYLLAAPAIDLVGTAHLLVGAALLTLVVTPLPLLVRGGPTFSSEPPRGGLLSGGMVRE